MSTFVLAADPTLGWSTTLSSFAGARLRTANDGMLILDGLVSLRPATIELYGSNFGAQGANLLNGAAQVNTVRYTVNGQAVMNLDGAQITGSALSAWMRGDGNAFERAASWATT